MYQTNAAPNRNFKPTSKKAQARVRGLERAFERLRLQKGKLDRRGGVVGPGTLELKEKFNSGPRAEADVVAALEVYEDGVRSVHTEKTV